MGQSADNIVKRQLDEMASAMVAGFVAQAGSGTVIAVNDFQNLGKEPTDLHIGESVGELLSRAFANSPEVTVVERKNLAKLFDELNLMEAGVVEDNGAVEAGRLLGANYIVLGSVARLGSQFMINGRVVDTNTGKVVTANYTDIDANSLIVTSSDLFTPRKNQILAAFMSVIPGAGQLFNNKPRKAMVYLAAVGGSMLAGRMLYDQSQVLYDDYKTGGMAAVDSYEEADMTFQNAQMALYVAGGIWAWNILDAFWDAGALSRKVRKAKKNVKTQN